MHQMPRRGRTHNAEAAREAILNAAEKAFAANGFAGARVDAIATEAGYNKSLIFQYFGDKSSLYASVLRRADEQIRSFQNQIFSELMEEEITSDIDHLKALLKAFLSAYFDYLVDHPNFMRILNWEMAEGWQIYPQIATDDDREEIATLSAVLQKIAETGYLRSQFNPTGQLFLALFTSQLYLSLLPLFNIYLPGPDTHAQDELPRAREFIVGLILNGLLADSDAAKK